MPLHPLNNFKIQKHYHDGVDSRNNLIKNKGYGACSKS